MVGLLYVQGRSKLDSEDLPVLEPPVNHLCRGHNDGTCLFSRSHATTDGAVASPKLLIGVGFDWLVPARPVQLIKVYIT